MRTAPHPDEIDNVAECSAYERSVDLRRHSIEAKIVNCRCYALNEYLHVATGVWHSEWIDVTAWTNEQLMRWLGY
jgi:single-stranded DNA-binding protein